MQPAILFTHPLREVIDIIRVDEIPEEESLSQEHFDVRAVSGYDPEALVGSERREGTFGIYPWTYSHSLIGLSGKFVVKRREQ